MEEWRYSSTILDLGTRLICVVSITPQPIYPGKRAPGTYCIGGRVGTREVLDAVEKRKVSFPSRESKPGPPARRYSDAADRYYYILLLLQGLMFLYQ
jgi:hypothetical protein